MLTISEMMEGILTRAKGRYDVSLSDGIAITLPLIEIDFNTVQLKRINRPGAGWKTILIAAFSFDPTKIQGAFRWAADVRDMLVEPQIADLYMFMLIEGIASEDAARLETDESFCRKIVVRECEDVDSFLNRSFLATLSPSGVAENISDPLRASLSLLSQEHSWVETHLETWRELLLSGKSGSDIAEALMFASFNKKDTK